MLCTHPNYEPQETGEHVINCVPLDNAPERPRSMMAMEVENMKQKYQRLSVSELHTHNFFKKIFPLICMLFGSFKLFSFYYFL